MGKLKLIILFLLGWCMFGHAQTVFLGKPYDLGIIDKSSQRYVDIPIKNTSDKKVFIFRADVDDRFFVRYSSKEIKPDSTVYMRVQFTPTQKGIINEEIKVHFSCYTEPKTVKINGYTQEVPNNQISCPHFNEQSVNTSLDFEFEVKVIDKQTREPIPKANVLMIHNGIPAHELTTNFKGEAEKVVELGLYYFVTTADTYLPKEFPKYINRNNNYVLVELEKDPNEEIITEVIDEPEPEPDPEPVPEDTITDIAITIPDEPDSSTVEIIEPPITHEELYPDFPLSKYKPTNVVFLVDVSSSMLYTGKLDLLKAAMIELTGMLRPVDKITLVSYASNAKVLLETMPGDDHDSIVSTISRLKGGGYTAGGEGMKLAYKKAEQAFIKDGNNIVIMATDGGFNRGDGNPKKLAAKYQKRCIPISIIGIRNRQMEEMTLKNVVDQTSGEYVRIETYDEAKGALIDEIKRSAKW